MNAILSKDQGLFVITFVTSNGIAMLAIKFDDWLSARVALDIFGDEECLTIENIKDTTNQAEYLMKGVDYDFTF
jgi:hypothetical protein